MSDRQITFRTNKQKLEALTKLRDEYKGNIRAFCRENPQFKRRTVGGWQKAGIEAFEMKVQSGSAKKRIDREYKGKYAEMEVELVKEFNVQQTTGGDRRDVWILQRATSLMKTMHPKAVSSREWVGSNKWLRNFKRRHGSMVLEIEPEVCEKR